MHVLVHSSPAFSSGGEAWGKDEEDELIKKEQQFSSSPTFIIVSKADIARLDDLGQIYMKTAFSVLLWDFSSFRFNIGSQLWSLQYKIHLY